MVEIITTSNSFLRMNAAMPPPATPPALTRRQRLAARKDQPVWRVINALGSLKFALVLLATIAIACAAATFTESSSGTRMAQAAVYKAPWFLVWLGALCVNLFAVTLTRWPWEKRHIGFVVTHYGIITLLAGAVIGLQTGFEGNITLRTGVPPSDRITINRSIIQLQSANEDAVYTMPFEAETAGLDKGKTRRFPLPQTDLAVVADNFSANTIRDPALIPSESPTAPPGVQLRLSSGMMGQTLNFALTLSGDQPTEQDLFGLARIIFLPRLAQDVPPPRETQMVFAKYESVVSGAVATGVTVRISADGEQVAVLGHDGTGASYDRREIMGKPFTEAGASITVQEYWPDFAMIDGRPGTKSDQPNNPALLVQLVKLDASDLKPKLEMAVQDGQAVYQLSRHRDIYASGAAQVGDSFDLGWADWRAAVVQILPHAEVREEIKPGPPLPTSQQGIPGIRAHLESPGSRGPDVWLQSGKVGTLRDGPNAVRFGYGLDTKILPFTIRLLSFEVPRDEGTDTPADFRATVEFRDKQTGETKTGVARMNNPASFPGTLIANFTGINYKFSQAEWNPRNLDETTLQILYDPGWLLKWLGSLGICVGIAIMFYWKPSRDPVA